MKNQKREARAALICHSRERGFLFREIHGEIEAVEEFKEGFGRGGDGKIGEVGGEESLPPLEENGSAARAPGKLVGALELGEDLLRARRGGFFLYWTCSLRAADIAEEFQPLDDDHGEAGELGVESKMAEGVVGFDVGFTGVAT